MSRTVVLLTADLTTVSRIEGAAIRAGASLRGVSTIAQAVEQCAAESAAVLIVDLTLPALNTQTLVEQLEAAMKPRPRIVAFGPHVHEERLAAARDAGCEDVISRGQFFAQLDTILGR